MNSDRHRRRADTEPALVLRSRWVTVAALTIAGLTMIGGSAYAASLPLTWNAPSTNADGTRLTDLASYRIYLGASAPSCPSSSFHSVPSPTPAPASGQTVSTRVAALTAGTTYFARVTAVDTAGNESACSSSVNGVAQSDLAVAPTGSVDFGNTALNGAVDRLFTVQNSGTTSISGTVSTSSPFSIVSGGTFSLAAGATHTVTVRFRPTTAGSFASNVRFSGGGDTLSRAVSGSSTSSSTTPTTATLTVVRTGTGTGTVSSTPPGITCGSDCTESGSTGTRYTLAASPASGSTFVGWSGSCTGSAACVVTVNSATSVTAIFDAVPAPPASAPSVSLTVNKNGTGSGIVSSTPTGISCGADCTASGPTGKQYILTASAAPGSTFGGWSGACHGTGTCAVTVNATTSVTATFTLDQRRVSRWWSWWRR
jgi:hypothetical protein